MSCIWLLAIAADPGTVRLSCGGACLYVLLQFHETAQFSSHVQSLPAGWSSGKFSLKVLAEEAANVGLRLRPANVRELGHLPEAPFIAHIQKVGNPDRGHFVVLRLIDRKGRQYQLIDPPNPPQIIEEADSLQNPCVTGWALVEDLHAPFRTIGGWALVLLGVLGVLVAVMKARRKTKPRIGSASLSERRKNGRSAIVNRS